jgi:hypothetical protein
MEQGIALSSHKIRRPTFISTQQPQHSSLGTFFNRARKFDCFGIFRSNKLSPEQRDKEKGVLDNEIRKEKGVIKITKGLHLPYQHLIPRTNNKIEKRNNLASVGSTLESVVEE